MPLHDLIWYLISRTILSYIFEQRCYYLFTHTTRNQQRMEQKNRLEGRNSSLNDSRLERLQMIGFRWAKRKGQASWNEKFNELVQYKARNGNCHVPTKYKANTALGRWVSTQRAEYKKYSEGNTKTTMTAEKIRRLEGIGFAWFMSL